MENTRNFNPAVCAAVHTVSPGETLYGIAGMYGTDYQRLMVLNGITDPNSIYAGQEICIPPGRAPRAGRMPGSAAGNYNGAGSGAGNYSAAGGAASDYSSAGSAAGNYSAAGGGANNYSSAGSAAGNYSATGGAAGNYSSAGSAAGNYNDAGSGAGDYTIKAGDTLYGISRAYGITLSALMAANPDIDPYNLRAGTTLNIPAAGQTAHPADDIQAAVSRPSGAITQSHAAAHQSAAPARQAAASQPDAAAAVSQTGTAAADTAYSQPYTAAAQAQAAAPDGIIHTVAENESLTSILTLYNICYHALLSENPGTDLTGDLTGTTLCIPYKDIYVHTPANKPYTVRSGDTLIVISENTGTSADELLRTNPCCSPLDFSVPGTRIRV